mmetsp:Transcript_97479/g.281264  ORF Transcript_97479/g.281264 Transcript_97479/m.281264 type:complete len:95 (+) Transcript_97479:465-749(+)
MAGLLEGRGPSAFLAGWWSPVGGCVQERLGMRRPHLLEGRGPAAGFDAGWSPVGGRVPKRPKMRRPHRRSARICDRARVCGRALAGVPPAPAER